MNIFQGSRFAVNPTADIRRSILDRPQDIKLSFNVGDLIPFYVDEVLPGDTFDIRTSLVARLQTPLTPFMDNIELQIYYFFVPYRLCWSHWRELMGENTASAWIPAASYTIPQLEAPSGGWNIGTIADYLGIPTGVGDISVSALPFRAYALVCSEWFRSEVLSDPLVIPTGDSTVTGVNTGTFVTDVAKGGLPYKAAKYFDYFTGALPAPQKGPSVTLGVAGNVPVVTGASNSDWSIWPKQTGNNYAYPLKYGLTTNGANLTPSDPSGVTLGVNSSANAISKFVTSDGSEINAVVPRNLYADLSGITVATVNQLRMAFQLQKLLEKDARGGTRYIEIIKSHFGVTSPDSRLQRPEFLGGKSIPLRVTQIASTAGTASAPQGATTAYSLTADVSDSVYHSFTEHGVVLGLAVARYRHTYQQGIERFWSRKDRYDFYWPVLANIGEQAIFNKEIYAQGSSTVDADGNIVDDQVFGYQEAWADYRYKPNRVAGEMRSAATTSLDVWHLGDDYNSLPYLSDSWIREDQSNVDRVLAVTSSTSNQVFMDVLVQNKSTRPMPVYSIPGLIDHH